MAQLSPLLLLGGLSFVPLRWLGQDHVENLFCCVRGRNGFNSRPEYSAFRPALRACALTSMLRPVSSSGNCETDGDDLLVNILEKATSDCRNDRAHRAAATAAALVRSLLGEGVDLDDEGGCGGVLSDEEDQEHAENSLAESEQQVVDRIGGYIVNRLGRQDKLRCADCRAALVRSSSPGILVQERQQDGALLLQSSSETLTEFMRHCESCF